MTLLARAGALLAVCAAPALTAEAPKTLDPKASCVSPKCHADFAEKKHVHGPVSVGECKACHLWKDSKHDFSLVAEGTKLCLSCHDDVQIASKKKDDTLVVHDPVKEDCANCHDPHASDNKHILASPMLELCETCHDELFARLKSKKNRSSHSVALEGTACLTCHEPHSSHNPHLFTRPTNDLCLSCHDKEIKTGGRIIANIKAELSAKKVVVHGPIEDEGCIMCHGGHASTQIALLTRTYPSTFYAPFAAKSYGLCFDCHEPVTATAAETGDDTEFRNGKRNLHYVHVNKPRKGRTCGVCHTSHASTLPHQLRAWVAFGPRGWRLPIGFKPTDTGGSCSPGCHAPKAYDREKPVKY